MTYIIALLVLLTLPVFVTFLRQQPHRRGWALMIIGAVPFLTDVPVSGFLYGWATWSGISRGFGVSIVDTAAIALILTRRRIPGTLPYWGLFAFYALPVVLSVFVSQLWVASLFNVWQLGRMAVIFIAIGGEAHRPEMRAPLLAGLAIGLMYQAAIVIPQKLSGVIQAAGTMPHQNILGLTIELSIVPLMASLLAGSRRKIEMAGIVAGLICVAGTGSRGTVGIVGGAIVLLVLLSVIRRVTPNKMKIVGFGVLGLAVAMPLALQSLNSRFGGASLVTEENERSAFEEVASNMARDYPLGVGINNFVLVSNRDGYATRAGVPWQESDRSMPVHNAYLLARAETSWLGEFAFILMLVVPMISALRFAFADRKAPTGEVALGVGVAIAANMLHNNFEFATHTFVVQSLLVINMGVIAALVRERKMEKRRRRREAAARARAERDAAAAPAGGPQLAGA